MAKGMWEKIKAEEKAEKRAARAADGRQPEDHGSGYLDGVAVALPALTRALKLQQKAARVDFDWKQAAPILDKINEELAELKQAIENGDRAGTTEEFGDLLFSIVNYGRHLGVDPEAALRQTNEKFRNRFHHVEARLTESGASLESATLEEMEKLWQDAKAR